MSVVISQARLALGRAGPARRSSSEYLTHQAVADLFGDRPDRGYLFRPLAEWPGGADVLVLSRGSPLAPERLPQRPHGRAVRVQSKAYAPELRVGQLLDFELRINATRVVTDPETGKKYRTDVWEAVWRADRGTAVTPHSVYGEYLARKLSGAAELVHADGVIDCDSSGVRVTERGEVRARRGDRPEAIRFVFANLIGTLRVLDPSRLLETIASGIGREKAFGCGLLCISRPGTVLARRPLLEVEAL
jgi:CRISPR system Cascade subunit CasE